MTDKSDRSATYTKSEIVALIYDLEADAIRNATDDPEDEGDLNSFGSGYDLGYLAGLRAARFAVEEI